MSDTSFIPSNYTHNSRLDIQRKPELQKLYPSIKDPSIVRLADSTYQMFTTLAGASLAVGRFHAIQPSGPWFEMDPVKFVDLSGPELCAPAMHYEEKNGLATWTMYIQTSCFSENGYIAVAHSHDGETFYGDPEPVITRNMLGRYVDKIVGLYDAGVSEISIDNQQMLCMLFSGYRKIGCGDIFMTYRPKQGTDKDWAQPQLILAQEHVPFHNQPESEGYEWGLEGAQITQIGPESFLLFGVCFLPKPGDKAGTRQRVFMAYASSLLGPFVPITTPFEPDSLDGRAGENGHADVILDDEDLWIIYQERYGEGRHWHLRSACLELDSIDEYLLESINKVGKGFGLKLATNKFGIRTSNQKITHSVD